MNARPRQPGASGRSRALLLLLLALVAPHGTAQPAYDSRPDAKAMAVLPGQPEQTRAVVDGQPNDLAASIAAREQCQSRAPAGSSCEVVRLNDERITSGLELRARVPEGPHPLFLWRLKRHATVVYLAGSIHVLKPSLYPLPPQLAAAFDKSDTLVLEVNLSGLPTQELQQRTLQHALLPDGTTLSSVLPPGLQQRLQTHLADYGLTQEMVERAKPAMVMNQIVVSRLMALGYLPDSGVENYFLGRRDRRPVLELESLDDQLALLFDQPLDTQVELLDETLEVAQHIEPLLADMLVAWLAGDDAAFLEAFKAQSGDSPEALAFTRELLEDRNHVMADGIAGFLQPTRPGAPAQTYFVLVGAAHLVGEEGIVPLLAARGFRGRRLTSTDVVN